MWTDFFHTFDPWSTLTPDRVDGLYVDRPGAPGLRIARRIQNAGSLSRWVLCGARGCGKSTELARIAHHLRAGHQVVHVDVSHALPEGAGMLSVLLVVGAAVVGHLEREEQSAAEVKAAREAFAGALSKVGWVAETTSRLLGLVGAVVMSAQSWALAAEPDAAGAAVGLAQTALDRVAREAEKKAVELRALLEREALGGALRPEDRDKADRIADAVNEAIQTLSTLHRQRVLLLVDGVDRQKSAEITFTDASLLTRLDSHVVLTAPIALRHSPGLTALPGCVVEKVPNLKVVDRSGAVQEDAVDLLVRMVQQRLEQSPAAVQRALRAEQLRPIAHLSSGLPRELIEFIRVAGDEALVNDREVITDEDLLAGVRERRLRNTEVLRTPDWDLLSQALETGEAPGEAADELLFNNLLVCYYNDSAWYRPHETLMTELQRRRSPERRA